jgi:hypothetical protein
MNKDFPLISNQCFDHGCWSNDWSIGADNLLTIAPTFRSFLQEPGVGRASESDP